MLETLLPFQLGRYRLESLIGQGGMARVFRAVLLGPAGFEKTVAIKLMTMVRTDKASADFRREAVYASRIHHPNVVDVYELGDAEGCPFIAMEWVAGESLHHLLQTRGPPPGSAALDLMVALLNGLEQAHRGDPASQRPGMLHRDIKPSNIIISRFGVPKLLDFGIAVQMAGPDSSLVPAEGRVIGTLNWMSPEQIQGHALDERSDLFSFGLIIANIVLGRNPLRPGYLRDQVTAQAPIPNGLLKPEDQSALDARIPGLGAIVASTLRRDVNERPRNAFQLRKALQALRPAVGHRPSLPQWMTERDPSHPPNDPPPWGVRPLGSWASPNESVSWTPKPLLRAIFPPMNNSLWDESRSSRSRIPSNRRPFIGEPGGTRRRWKPVLVAGLPTVFPDIWPVAHGLSTCPMWKTPMASYEPWRPLSSCLCQSPLMRTQWLYSANSWPTSHTYY